MSAIVSQFEPQWRGAFEAALAARAYEVTQAAPSGVEVTFSSHEAALGAVQCFWIDSGPRWVGPGPLRNEMNLTDTIADRQRGDRTWFTKYRTNSTVLFAANNDSNRLSQDARDWLVKVGFATTEQLG